MKLLEKWVVLWYISRFSSEKRKNSAFMSCDSLAALAGEAVIQNADLDAKAWPVTSITGYQHQ